MSQAKEHSDKLTLKSALQRLGAGQRKVCLGGVGFGLGPRLMRHPDEIKGKSKAGGMMDGCAAP